MRPTTFETFTIVGRNSTTPSTVVKGPLLVPVRVLVSNVGPVLCWVAQDPNDLTPPGLASYRVFPGEQHVFVLAANQSLYAKGIGTGGMLSISISEAIPTDTPRA